MRDFGDKRSTTPDQDPKAADVDLAPGKRTQVEMLSQPPSAPEIPVPASAPVARRTESSAPGPATPSGPRPTILDLFGRVQCKAAGAEPDAGAVHASAQRGVASGQVELAVGERPIGTPNVGLSSAKRTLTEALPPSRAAVVQRAAAGPADGVALSSDAGKASDGSGSPMPAAVQAKMDRAFAADFSAVRIHEGAQAPTVGALAYTEGSNIHFGPGQYRPDTQSGQELLGHELAHVVQQSQGRVQATTQAKGGIAINDDSGLEREADDLGARAARGEQVRTDPVRPASDDRGVVSRAVAPRGGGSAAIQRKLGFEFESQGDTAWRFHARNDDRENWAGINHTKEIIVATPNGKAGLGADTGRIEVITKPLTSWADIVATFNELYQLLGRFADKETELSGAENATAHVVTGRNHHRINGKGRFVARPQATIGVAPMNVEALFKQFMAMNANPKDDAERALSSKTLVYQMNVSIAGAHAVLESALKAAGVDKTSHDPLIYQEMSGALMLILKTLWDAYSNSGSDLTDPKYAFPMMPRTDFKSMLGSLEPISHDLMIDLWAAGGGPLAHELDSRYELDALVFTGGYRDENKKRQKGPTKREWLNSIFTGSGPKDLLSPPPGYPAHANTARPEGLGAYQADGHLALFELRDIMGKNPIPVDAWLPLARKVAHLVATVEKDDALMPR